MAEFFRSDWRNLPQGPAAKWLPIVRRRHILMPKADTFRYI